MLSSKELFFLSCVLFIAIKIREPQVVFAIFFSIKKQDPPNRCNLYFREWKVKKGFRDIFFFSNCKSVSQLLKKRGCILHKRWLPSGQGVGLNTQMLLPTPPFQTCHVHIIFYLLLQTDWSVLICSFHFVTNLNVFICFSTLHVWNKLPFIHTKKEIWKVQTRLRWVGNFFFFLTERCYLRFR